MAISWLKLGAGIFYLCTRAMLLHAAPQMVAGGIVSSINITDNGSTTLVFFSTISSITALSTEASDMLPSESIVVVPVSVSSTTTPSTSTFHTISESAAPMPASTSQSPVVNSTSSSPTVTEVASDTSNSLDPALPATTSFPDTTSSNSPQASADSASPNDSIIVIAVPTTGSATSVQFATSTTTGESLTAPSQTTTTPNSVPSDSVPPDPASSESISTQSSSLSSSSSTTTATGFADVWPIVDAAALLSLGQAVLALQSSALPCQTLVASFSYTGSCTCSSSNTTAPQSTAPPSLSTDLATLSLTSTITTPRTSPVPSGSPPLVTAVPASTT